MTHVLNGPFGTTILNGLGASHRQSKRSYFNFTTEKEYLAMALSLEGIKRHMSENGAGHEGGLRNGF
jgi:hypothetical protein